MAHPLWAGYEALGKALQAAGVPVVLDPSAFTAPCVMLEAPSVTTATLGAWEITVPVVVVGQAPATRDTLEWMLDTVEAVMGALGIDQADPSVFTYSTQPFPAYRLTAGVTVTREN